MASSGNNRYSSRDQRELTEFTVYMNDGERHQIEKWVERYPNIETGGDLFGAWIDDRKAVVQFVLGPGRNCRRTGVSFFQDIDYLREAGSYLTQKHGLCNIGQWHSHHRLGLTRPSGGDENTVWGNMPNLGLDRYIVIIATITGSSRSYYQESYGGSYPHMEELTVNMNPYLFEIKNGHRRGVLPGSFDFMKQNSPFRVDKGIRNKVKIGAETTNAKRPHETETGVVITKITKTEGTPHHNTQSLAQNTGKTFDNNDKSGQSEIQQGDGTEENPEDVSNEDKESGQSNIPQGDGTEENPEDVPNEDKESGQSNIPQGDGTEENPEDVPNEDEESGQSTIPQGDGTEENPEDVPNEDKESGQSTIPQGDGTEENPEDVSNEDKESGQSTIPQGDGTEENPEDVPNEDEESGEFNIPPGESTERDLRNVWNEDEVSVQSNIRQGQATKRNLEDVPNEDEESGQSNIPQGDGTDRNLRNVSNEDAESRKSNIGQGDGSDNNLQAEDDSNEKSETATSASNEDAEMIDLSQNDPKGKVLSDHEDEKTQVEADNADDGCQGGQCGQSHIPQKYAKRDLKQSLDEDSLNHFLTEQNEHNKTDEERTKNDIEKDEDKDDGELDGANNADEATPSESKEGRNATTTENSGFEGRNDKPDEKEDGKLDGPQEDEIENATESPNMTNDTEDQDDNAISNASKPAGGPDETQVESVENLTSGESGECTEGYFLGEKNEQPIPKSDNQPQTPDWKEVDDKNADDEPNEKITLLNTASDSMDDSNKNQEIEEPVKGSEVDSKTLDDDENERKTMDGQGDDKRNNTLNDKKLEIDVPVKSIGIDPKAQRTDENTSMTTVQDGENDNKLNDKGTPVSDKVQERIVDVSNSEPMDGKRSDKNKNSKRSRSIFDPPAEHEEQELTRKDEIRESETKVGTEAVIHTFKENETNNEGKDSQDNKRDLSNTQSDESVKTTEFERIDSDSGKNNEIISENPNKDGPSASEINMGKDEAVGIQVAQNEIDQIETIAVEEPPESQSKDDNKERKKKRKGFIRKIFKKKKSKQKLERQNDNGENVAKKKKGKIGKAINKMKFWKSRKEKKNVSTEDGDGDIQINDENIGTNPVDLATNRKESNKSKKRSKGVEVSGVDAGTEENTKMAKKGDKKEKKSKAKKGDKKKSKGQPKTSREKEEEKKSNATKGDKKEKKSKGQTKKSKEERKEGKERKNMNVESSL